MKFDDVDKAVAGTRFMTTEQARTVYDFIVDNKLSSVLELGFAHGKSTCYFAAAVQEVDPASAKVVTMDLHSTKKREPNIDTLLERTGLGDLVTPVYANTSYTWELMKLIEQPDPPKFDFVYIDGGHTWDVSGYGFFLTDKLLAPGGWVLFDDLDWTLGGSATMKTKPWVQKLPAEERDTAQVRKVFELLVAQHQNYTNVHEKDHWGWAQKKPEATA